MKKGNTITYNDLTRMISEAIEESYLQGVNQAATIAGGFNDYSKNGNLIIGDENGNYQKLGGMKNAQMFQNYLRDIDQELKELYVAVRKMMEHYENNVKDKYDEYSGKPVPKYGQKTETNSTPTTNESRIEQSVRNVIRRFINEELQASGDNNVQGDNANSQNNEASILDGLIQTLSLVKLNGGDFNGLPDEQLRGLLDQLKKTYSQANRQVNGTNGYGDFDFNQQYNSQWRNGYFTNQISKLLNDIQRKYLAIYQGLTNSAMVNESLGTWFRNKWDSNVADRFNGLKSMFSDKNRNRKLTYYRQFYNTLKRTYEGIFAPLKKALEEKSYYNAEQFIQQLMQANETLLGLLETDTQQGQQNNQTNSSQNVNNGNGSDDDDDRSTLNDYNSNIGNEPWNNDDAVVWNDDGPVITSSGNEPWNDYLSKFKGEHISESELHTIIRNAIMESVNPDNGKRWKVYFNGSLDKHFTESAKKWKKPPKVGEVWYAGGTVFKIVRIDGDRVYTEEDKSIVPH